MASRAFHYILTPHSPIKEGQHSTSLQSKSEKTTANFKKPPGGGADHHSGRPNYIVVTLRPRPTFFFLFLLSPSPRTLSNVSRSVHSRSTEVAADAEDTLYASIETHLHSPWMDGWLVSGWVGSSTVFCQWKC